MNGGEIRYTIGFDADISSAKASMDSLQKTFSNFGLSSNFGDKINQEFAKFGKAYDTYMSKINNGIKTKADYSAVTKSLNDMKSAMAGVAKEAVKVGHADPFKAFKNDSVMSGLLKQIEEVQHKINNFKFDTSKFKGIFDQIGANISKSNTNIPNLMDQIMKSNQAGNYEGTISGLNRLQNAVALSKQRMEELAQQYKKGSAESDAYKMKAEQLGQALEKIKNVNPSNLTGLQTQLESLLGQADSRAKALATSWQDFTSKVQQSQGVVAKTADSLQRIHKEEFGMQRQIEMVDRQIQSYFGLTQILRKVMNIARQAMTTVKELDKSMTETAVVTNFDVGDMWEKLPEYTAMANQLGSTIKDVYDATTLYYQQGLNTSQAMGIAEQTLKMARIGGIEAAEATNMMTAALRGFNMQINEMSAQNINDVYSKVAAMSASNTKELGEAMERTASIANSAGMEFGNTTAFLAQMIETTREAPENLGTAMKTIIARFQEMKKSPDELIDVEGDMLDVNRVDKALKSVGIALTDETGNFRNLDQVLLEISKKWDSLSMGQQRYIATMAAGSRQQSRFIALVGNHERLMELVDGANNSAGASQEQFNKTLDSFATKAGKLKNAWDQFTMGLLNDKMLKGAVDSLTGFMTIVNKIIDVVSSATGPFKGVTKSFLTLAGVMTLLSTARMGLSAGVSGAFNWFAGKTTMAQLFGNAKDAIAQGTLAGTSYVKAAATAVSKEGKTLKQSIQAQWNQKGLDTLSNKNNYQTWKTEDGKNATVAGQIKALKAGELQATKANLDSIRGGITQSLFSNSNFVNSFTNEEGVSTAVRDGGQLIDNYVKALTQQIKIGTGKGAKEAQAAVKQARGAIGKAAFQGALKNGSTKEEASKAAAQAIKDAEQNVAMIPTTKVDAFAKGVSNANSGLMQLGMLLQNTPLAPFGKMLTMVSMALSALSGMFMGLGGALASLSVNVAISNGLLKEEQVALFTSATFTEADTAAKWHLIKANGLLATSMMQLVLVFAAVAAAALVIVGIFKMFTAESAKLEQLHDRAAAASDAFKSVKQEVSELKDNLDTLAEYDEAFKTLVSGTAEFNSKLLESNELVNNLIKKYPMLTEQGYVTTDQNGRIQISQAGREAVKQEMTERQAKAQAIDIFANADYQRQQAKMSKEYEKAYASENVGVAGSKGFRRLALQRNQDQMASEYAETTDDVMAKAEAKVKLSQKAAVSAMLATQKDLMDQSAVSQVIGEGYDQLASQIKADASGADRAKTYAEAYGYEYIKGNKFKDQSGNEIEIKKDVWNDETTNQRIKANNQIIESASTLDRALIDMNSKVSDVFGKVKIESDTLISDILSSNVNTNRDDLEKIVDSGKLQELYDSLSKEEQQALKDMGIEDFEAYAQERIKAIQEAQAQQDVNLGSMLARSTGYDTDWFTSGTKAAGEQIKFLRNQLDSLSQEQKTFASETGTELETAFGAGVSDKFVESFVSGNDKVRKEFQTVFDDVDWSSSIDALGAMQSALDSNQDSVVELGEAMQNSVDGSHLLSDAMQEMYSAEDFTDALENLDNFVDASGRLNATGIEKMAEESGSLSKMLETGAISAGGLAAAINATSIDGVVDITDLSDSVLKLIGYFGELEDSVARSHDYIENFDAGIDTGESKDFVVENIEKIKEFVKNGEWGNEQLHNYIQSIIGTEAWENALQQSGDNYQKAYNLVSQQVNSYAKGYDKLWSNLSQGLDSTGKKFNNTKIKEDLGWDKNDKGITFTPNNKGELELRLNGHDLNDLNEYIQKVEGVGKEQADNIIQDWRNYSPAFDQQVREQSFNKGLSDQSFQDSHAYNGQLVLTKSELQTLADVSGKSRWDTRERIENADAQGRKVIANDKGKHYFNNMEGDQLRTDYKKMAEQFNTYLGLNANKSFAIQKGFKDENGTGYDVNKIISGYLEKGFTQLQSQGMAFEQMKANKNQTYTYNGKTVDPSKFDNVTEFLQSLTEIDQNVQWEAIGEAIAQGILKGINGNTDETGAPDTTNEGYSSGEKAAAEKQKTADAVKIQSLEADIQSYQAQIEAKQQEVKDAQAEAEAARKDAKKAKEGQDAAEQKVVEAEKKVAKAKEEIGDLKVLLKATQDELGKYRESGLPKKGSSKGDKTAAEEATETDLTVNFKANTEETDEALKKLEDAKDKDVTLTVHAKGADELEAATRSINGLQAAAKKGKKVTSNVTINSKKGSTKGITAITDAAKEADASVKVKAVTRAASDSVDNLISAINKKTAYISISPDYGSSLQWEKAVTVKIHATGGKVKKESSTTIPTDGNSIRVDGSNKGKSGNKGKTGKTKVATGGLINNSRVIYRAKGGPLYAFIPQGTDTVPAMLTPGEYVQRKAAVDHFGDRFMQNINHLNLRGALNSLPKKQLIGSMAKGSRTHGTLGPNDRGGLTLTGETGYEVAWIPSQNRSMIVGANGPEMLNLPKDTVVWNHKQSQKIIKKSDIPSGGSAAIGAGSADDLSTRKLITGSTYVQQVVRQRESGRGASKKDQQRAARSNKHATKRWKLKKEVGSTNVLIYNTEKKIEQVQKNIEQLQNKINKALEKSSVTLAKVTENVNKEVKQLQLSYALNTKLAKLYDKRLKSANTSKKKTTDISWTDTYQRKKKGGKGKETKTKRKKATISLSKYINYDEATGAYQLNQKALNKVYKKNKNKGKAIRTAAEKQINENTSKRDSAQKAADEAKQKIEELGKQLYDKFFGWENELTKILDLTNKITDAESKIGRLKGMQDLDTAMLTSGLQQVTTDFAKETIDLFGRQVLQMTAGIEKRREAITEQRKKIGDLISSADEQDLVVTLAKRGAVMETAAKKQEAYNKAKKAENAASKKQTKAQKKLTKDEKLRDKAKKLRDKGKTKKTEKKKISDKTELIKELKAKKKEAKSKKEKDKIQKRINKATKSRSTAKKNLKALKVTKKDIAKDKKALKNANKAKTKAGTNTTTAKDQLDDAKKQLQTLGLNADQYTATDILANSKRLTEAQSKLTEVKRAQQYVTATPNADGTIELSLNTEQLEADKDAGKISEEMYNAIKSYYEGAKDANDELINLYNDQLSALTDMYSLVSDLKEQYADYADELMNAMEEAQQEEIDNLSKLNDALTNHLKNLLDEVKRRLDQRRQAEDNAKTESDISKKQQRLAILRADTSGGHASEIKQLEQEIAEAQQNYGRTLEDQTLQRLEEQADKAAEQRNRMIELLQAQLEIQQEGNNKDQVNSLLERLRSGDETVQKQAIAEATELLKNNQDYDNQNTARQEAIMANINSTIHGLMTLPSNISAAEAQTLAIQHDVNLIRLAIEGLATPVIEISKATELLKNGAIVKDLRDQGFDWNTIIAALRNLNSSGQTIAKALIENGLTGKQVQNKTGASLKDIAKGNAAAGKGKGQLAGISTQIDVNGKSKGGNINAHVNATGEKIVGNKGSSLWIQNYDSKTGKTIGAATEKKVGKITKDLALNNKTEAKQAIEYAITHQKANTKINENLGAIAKVLGINRKAYKITTDTGNKTTATLSDDGHIYWYSSKYGIRKWNTATGKVTTYESTAKLKKMKKAQRTALKTSPIWREYKQFFDANKLKYKTGGLATETGPAWLDGTRAKPELVLNATDTKNFIALKDVLSSVMNGVNSMTDVSDVQGAPVTYDININVDHLNNDYDVDRVADRVKKIIVQDASYRNVTTVRKFR